MGGKTGQTTQQVTIPKEVLARYNAVNAQAQQVASTPFQQYSTDPNAFVAGINQQQYAGIGGINRAANMAQPSIAYAQQGLTGEGYQQGVQQYMNPYLQNAMGATAAQLNNVNQQQQQQLAGNAIQQGAFGGDRAGVAQANLMNQQNLAMGQTLGQMANQGYQQSAQNYMQGLGQIGQLGLQGQQAALQGAQAQLGAGTLEQQTQQAGQTALYNQFLQQQAYPFQVAQFLANIAMGTGANSGSTTTTTQPMPFFSDRRLKKDIKRIGESDEGLPIYKYKYKDDPYQSTQIGFMADEVEKKHPDAVGLAGGYKTVDYDRAAKADGGMSSEGGAVMPQHMGLGFAGGGDVAAGLNAMNAMQANMPVTTGGVDSGVAAQARAIAPQPVIPQSVFNTSSYNVFADPKYQPDFGKTGNGKNNGDGTGDNYTNHGNHDEEHNARPNRGNEHSDSGNRTDPFSDRSYSVDSNGMMHGSETGWSNNYDPTQGAAFAEGGRTHFNVGGYSGSNPYDPYDIHNILARQKAAYAELEGSHVPSSRKLSGGFGKGSRLPEANLPVGRVQVAGAPPAPIESGVEQGMSAMEKAQKISEMFSKDSSGKAGMGTQILDYLTGSGKSEAPASNQGQAAPKPVETKKTAGLGEEYDPFADLSQFANRGGLMRQHHATTGMAQTPEESSSGSAIDELYSSQNDPTKRDIVAKLDKSKLSQAGAAPTPTSQTGLSADTALSLGKFILPFFLNSGGRAGYDEGGPLTEEEIMKRTQYDPTSYNPKTQTTGGLIPASYRRQTETDEPDVYSRELQSFIAPRFRVLENRARRRGVELSPNELYRSPERSAYLDLTMPEGAPRAKPYSSLHNYGLAVDYSGINQSNLPAMRELAKETGLTLGADFTNADLPHVQATTASGGDLYPMQGKEFTLGEGALQSSYKGEVPQELVEAAYKNANKTRGLAGSQPEEKGLAGSQAEVPSTNRIGQRVGLTGVTPSGAYSEASQQTGPVGKLAKAVFGDEFPTSENIWVPALAGLGSMLSSKSPYFLPALGEGLLGATSAYSGLNKQQVDLAKGLADVPLTEATTGLTGAKTSETYTDIVSKSIQTNLNGETFIIGVNPDGSLGIIPEGKWRDMMEKGTLVVDPRTNKLEFTSPQQKYDPSEFGKTGLNGAPLPPAGTGAKVETGTEAKTGTGTGVAGAEPQPAKSENVFALNDEDKAFIKQEASRLGAPLLNEKNFADSKANFERINAEGNNALSTQNDIISLIGSLSQVPEQGTYSRGKTAPFIQGLADTVQDLAKKFSLPRPFEPGQEANEENIEKATQELINKAKESGNTVAASAFEELRSALPSKQTTKEGTADNATKILVSRQQTIDMRNMASLWQQYVKEASPRATGQEMYSGKNFVKWYTDKYSKMYEADQQALKKMFLQHVTVDGKVGMDVQTKQPISWFRYIQKHATDPSMFPTEESRIQFRDYIAETFGPNVVRYFPTLPQYK